MAPKKKKKDLTPDELIDQAYAKRKQLIAEIKRKLEMLPKGRQYDTLYRKLKALTVTDPTVYKEHTTWLKNLAQTSLIDTLEGHHINGLDDSFIFLDGQEDEFIKNFHADHAKLGNYYGNHPKNIVGFTKGQHVGRARTGESAADSVHGRLSHTRLDSPEDFSDWVYSEIGEGNRLKIGSPDRLSLEPSHALRLDVPSSADIDNMSYDQVMEKTAWLAERDKASVREVQQTAPKPKITDKHIPEPIKKITSRIPTESMSDELVQAINDGDWKTVRALGKTEVEAFETAQDLNIKADRTALRGLNLPAVKNLRRADTLAQLGISVSQGDVSGTAINTAQLAAGEALQTKAVQARLAKKMAALLAKRGGKTGLKLIPGVGLAISGAESYGYAQQGKLDQAIVAGLSGIVGELPGFGDALSAGLDLWNTSQDISDLHSLAQQEQDRLNATKNFE